MWRFRGVDPWEVHNHRSPGPGEPAWPSRREALLVAFAAEAAARERDVATLIEAFGAD